MGSQSGGRRCKRHCTTIGEGKIRHAEAAGKDTISFTDKLGKHPLALGSHSIAVTAAVPGVKAGKSLHVTVVIVAH